jgi:hypothetical protein
MLVLVRSGRMGREFMDDYYLGINSITVSMDGVDIRAGRISRLVVFDKFTRMNASDYSEMS